MNDYIVKDYIATINVNQTFRIRIRHDSFKNAEHAAIAVFYDSSERELVKYLVNREVDIELELDTEPA